ncbi:hypothetical protein ACHAXM_002590 [Skeletonema potamos]
MVRTTTTSLAYFVLAVFFAAVASKDYFFPQSSTDNVACSKFTATAANTKDDGGVQSASIQTAHLNEELWDQIKQKSCPNYTPDPSIWPILFEQARIELGFDLKTIPSTPKDVEFVNKFFTFSSGGIGYKSLDEEHHLVYLKVWKAANDDIRKNINLRVGKKDNLWDVDLNLRQKPDYSELWSPIPLLKRNQTCVVTTVRDPVEHFLSAYNELEFRSTDSFLSSHGLTENTNGKKPYTRYRNGTDARFERYVSDFIWGAASNDVYPSLPLSNIFHTFSQTGVLWNLKEQVDLVSLNAPRLTAYLPSILNVSAAFPNLVATNCPGFEEEFKYPFTKEFGHPSSLDEFGFYAAAKRVWSKQDSTSRALCALHLMDYACFDLIPIPYLCQDVFSDASFQDRLLGQATNNATSAHETKKGTATECTFCKGGILNLDLVVPETGGNSCGSIKSMATKEENETTICAILQKEERVCCPTEPVGDGDA